MHGDDAVIVQSDGAACDVASECAEPDESATLTRRAWWERLIRQQAPRGPLKLGPLKLGPAPGGPGSSHGRPPARSSGSFHCACGSLAVELSAQVSKSWGRGHPSHGQ